MSLQEQFAALAEEWLDHCRAVFASSNLDHYLRHPSFQALAQLGPDCVPLILEHYRVDELLPWEHLLEEITGVPMIENRNGYNVADVRQRWLEWGDRQTAR
jgi:hypothetical protein